MVKSIPHLNPSSAWSVQSISDLRYAKLGASLTPFAEAEEGTFGFLGVPFEGLNINAIGGKDGPDGTRAALSKLRPYSIDLDINFVETNGLCDLGNIDVDAMDYDTTFERTETVIKEMLSRGIVPVIAGGSHSISEATIRAFSDFHDKKIGLIWFDGHPDFMPDYKGDPHYCGCPLRRTVESGHVKPENVAFLGLCGFANSPGEIREARDMGITFYTMENFYSKGIEQCIKESLEIAGRGTDAIYVTFDIDAMDHTFAPATQYPRPGGFQPYEVMRFIRHLGMAGAGAFDITEYAPLIDSNGNTGNIIATLYCEYMAGKAWSMQNR